MILSTKTLRVDFIDVFGTRGACSKPSVFRNDLDSANRPVVSRGLAEHALNGFAGQFRDSHLLRRKSCQFPLLFGGGWRFDAAGCRLTEVAGEFAIEHAWIPPGARDYLG